MRKLTVITLTLFICLLTSNAAAQNSKTIAQRLSFEAGAGYIVPISSDKGLTRSDFTGFRSFYLGANYSLINSWGLRFSYSNNGFQDKNDSSMGTTNHKFMAEATLDIIESIEMQRNPFEIVAHGGVGMSMVKSKLYPVIDKTGTLQFGLMPLYRIKDNISINMDATYVINTKQNYWYNGQGFNEGGGHVRGEYFTMTVGLGVKFGF